MEKKIISVLFTVCLIFLVFWYLCQSLIFKEKEEEFQIHLPTLTWDLPSHVESFLILCIFWQAMFLLDGTVTPGKVSKSCLTMNK